MIKNIERSLRDLLGDEYCDAVSKTAEFFHGLSEEEAAELTSEKIDFFNSKFAEEQDMLFDKIGTKIFDEFSNDNDGAPTESFRKATNFKTAPIGGKGIYRAGEDGKLYFASKSEHYHASVGHGFPGFRLIENAKKLGILNATHNNTRGYVTRTLEREIIRTINSIDKKDTDKLSSVLSSKEPGVLNRVINLETGSLAVEAGIKMMLAKFYRLEKSFDTPHKNGKTPVFLVIADNNEGFEANYHGTTIIAQTFRGMWPDIKKKAEENEIYKVVSIRINDIDDFKEKIERYNNDKYMTAGFLHEIILMNYGGIKLEKVFLQKAYELCLEYETPTLVDEIQSCMWYEGMYLYRHYDLKPDFVILGKGFSGGEYPASKVVTTYEMDNLNQFGALVTNGQEELASLAYLIVMEFAMANSVNMADDGDYFEMLLKKLKMKYNNVIDKIAGKGHLMAIHFNSVDSAVDFVKRVSNMSIDISAHTYKANCPPAALLKPPIIMSRKIIDYLFSKLDEALSDMAGKD